METRGILKSLEGNVTIVGEVQRYSLTLVPFEKRLLKKEDLEGKRFLGNFYVSQVFSIKKSENNYDAVEVVLDLITVQKFDPSKFVIWNLGDRNIPVDIEKTEVKDVSLVQKSFSLLKTPSIDFLQHYHYLYGLLVLILAGLIPFVLIGLSKRTKKVKPILWRDDFKAVASREDLERLYFNKYQIIMKIRDEAFRKEVQTFFSKYAHDQFSPSWNEKDISGLIKEANELGEGFESGV